MVTLIVCFWLQKTVTEEKRLAVAVHQIDEEVSVVPCGAFAMSPRGLVQLNRSFGGKSVYASCICHTHSVCLDSLVQC